MREIKSYDEFQVGKQYKRVARSTSAIVDIVRKQNGAVFAQSDAVNGENEWEVAIGGHSIKYYHMDDILSDSEEL